MISTVSVIIPTYNYGRFIKEAIESALAQTIPPLEIIVVDDGSRDETANVVREFRDKVRYIKQDNAGVCAARNRGTSESRGELIAFLDADDSWMPTKIEKQIAKFAEDEEFGLVQCGMREFDGDTGETLDVLIDGCEGWVADDLILFEKPTVYVSGSVWMVKREIFEKLGGFDTDMKVAEDWDFCYRVARLYKIGFVPESLVNYRRHLASAHLDLAEMERGMSHFYRKVFESSDRDVLKLRHRAYGNLYRVLSGSYFQSGNYTDFFRHAMKSIWNRPANLSYFLQFPLRRLRTK